MITIFTFVEFTVEYFQLSLGWFHLVVYTTASVNIALTIFLTDKTARALDNIWVELNSGNGMKSKKYYIIIIILYLKIIN